MNGSVVVQKERDLVRLKERGYCPPYILPFSYSKFVSNRTIFRSSEYRRREKGNIREFSHPPSYSSENTSHNK